jgi:O-antigen ligase
MGDGFRSPKLWLAELLALVSLLALVGRLSNVERLDLARLARQPGLRVVVPLLAVAVLSSVGSGSPAAVAGALASLAIGAAALVGWSLGLPRHRLRALLTFLLLPAAILAALGILQFHGLFRPFDFTGSQEAQRLGITSLAGSASDLGAVLALAALVGQVEVLRRRGRARWGMVALVAVLAYGVLITQTLTAVAALGLGSLVLWGLSLPRKRRFLALGTTIGLLVVVAALVSPLRERVVRVGELLAHGELNTVLTGRLDGWRVALRMVRDHPVNGVGHGAFEASYADAKLELVDAGVPFFPGQSRAMFANAHNELLEVAAEWGVPGLLVLIWGLWIVVNQVRRRGRKGEAAEKRSRDQALAWAGLTALAVLSLTYFPFRVALVAYPALVFLAWILSPEESEDSEKGSLKSEARTGIAGRTVAWLLVPLLIGALVLQGRLCRNHWRAARVLRVVEAMTRGMVHTGRGNAGLLWRHVRLLEDAERLDGSNAAIPLAKGSQYRLLRRPQEAQEAYRRALALEPRPEIWLNLGAAQVAAEDKEAARESFLKAVKLDPRMRSQVPQPYRTELPTRLELLNRTGGMDRRHPNPVSERGRGG